MAGTYMLHHARLALVNQHSEYCSKNSKIVYAIIQYRNKIKTSRSFGAQRYGTEHLLSPGTKSASISCVYLTINEFGSVPTKDMQIPPTPPQF